MKNCLLLLAAFAAASAAAPTARAQATFSFGLRLGGNYATRSGDDPQYIPYTGTSGGTGTGTTSTSQQDYSRKGIIAPQFGAVLEVRFGKMALQPAILFSQKGVDQVLNSTVSQTTNSSFGGFPLSTYTATNKFHSTSRANFLEIPFNLVYTSGEDHGFQVFAGPYVAFGVGGRTEIENEGTTVTTNAGYTSTSNNYTYGKTFFLFRDTYPGAANTTTTPGQTAPTTNAPFDANSGAVVARRVDAGFNVGVGYRFSALQVQLGYGLGLLNQQTGKAPSFRDDLPAYRQRVAQLTATYFFKAK